MMNNVYTNMKQEILNLNIKMFWPELKLDGRIGKKNQHLNETKVNLTQCTMILYPQEAI